MTSANKDVKISPGAVVCLESKLKGSITIGSMTVIHPKASVIAEAGPIILGENNIVEEQASIIYKTQNEEDKESSAPLHIGVNNVFEVGCEIQAKSIGNHNVFEPKCFVGRDVVIGNGCIIGAGCRITVAEKLPDHTVVTGRDCVRSSALDRPPAPDDTARQQDELNVMGEIFTSEEFTTCSKNEQVFAVFEAHIPLPKNFTLLLCQDSAKTDFKINHLPSIKLTSNFPSNYPSSRSPYFNLSCCWLSKTKLELIVKELERLWQESCSEILFIWCSFLKDQSLELLTIIDKYDLSEKSNSILEKLPVKLDVCKAEKTKNKNMYSKKTSEFVPNQRILDETNFLRIIAKEKLTRQNCELIANYHKESIKQLYYYIIDFNAHKLQEEFKKTMQECNVCFANVIGDLCKQLNCGHVTCGECLKRMCEVHIRHGTTESIVCAEENCGLEIPANEIKELVSQELYEQFDRLMLNKTLDKISTVYCPRTNCQYPVSSQGEESLAICPSCANAFCIFCKRPYHGIEGCKLKTEEKKELIEAYQSGDFDKRLQLEKRYGKKQLTELVNTAQTELWMSENSKPCPCCNVNIEKNDGCNKMICRKCNANFCWICLKRVSSLNPYIHFQDPSSKCFNLLFEGANAAFDEEDEEFEEIMDEEYEL